MRAIAIVGILAALFAPAISTAGTTGSLAGTVTTQYLNDAPIAGATVTIVSSAQREQTTSDVRGNFCFVSLAPGSYVLSISRAGYDDITKTVLILADESQHVTVGMARRVAPVRVDGLSLTMNPVRQGTIPDEYDLSSEMPFYDVNGTIVYALHFVPGLTFGAGPVLAR